MAGVEDDGADEPVRSLRDFNVIKQRVDWDIEFARQALKGSTEITIQPLIKDLRDLNLHCCQCRPTSVKVGGINARYDYDDPYRRVRRHENGTVYQHELLEQKIRSSLRPTPEPTLAITIPSKLKIQEIHVDPVTSLPQYNGIPSLQKQESDAMAIAETPTVGPAQPGVTFAPIKLYIEFEIDGFYSGLHWIGVEDGDKRYPYCYTTGDRSPGNTSALVPCVDDQTSRCAWEMSIRAPKTLGEAFKRPVQPDAITQPSALLEETSDGDVVMKDNTTRSLFSESSGKKAMSKYLIDLSEADAELELAIVCVGEQVDEVSDLDDDGYHTVSFSLQEPVTARHIGFAIGPFQRIDLSASRDAEEEERLGQNAVKVDAYCLPGRGDEVRNTCVPITKAIDYFGVNYGSYPFPLYQMLFVDDLVHDTVPMASLSLCSSRLLFDYEIIEPLETNTRELLRTVAEQWMGVNVIPRELSDSWAVAGVAGFMTDMFGKVIFGNNAYRWQQKLAAEKVYELDVDRPSVYSHGQLLHLDHTIRDFMDLKSSLVLFILDRRLMKANGSSGVTRIINRIFLHAKTGALVNSELSTADFQRTCEKLGHNKLDAFFRQWVYGAGCPIFFVTQRFNKKKLVVEMTIVQKQLERVTKPAFEPSVFMREVKEHVQEVWAPEIQPVFTGPMTIRIHEADGTPYEHIVEIKEATTRLEIPYNTKYKRLKRSRRQKERAMTDGIQNENGEDSLLYCLGDMLDSPEDVKDWNLADWTPEDEEKMGQESYEWIRIDADFEWIGKIHLVMPLYMYISQLQQDRDLVAQYESMRYLLGSNPHHVSLTILVRTLMDDRYFHGIRSMAAEGLAILSKEKDNTLEIGQFHLEKAFEKMFCFPGEIMPRPNDWSDRTKYIIQCAIPRAMSKLRNGRDRVPMAIRKFFVDKLKFNDNSNNEYSDCHYIATLMQCLTDTLIASHRDPEPSYAFDFGEDEPMVEAEDPEALFEQEAIAEIERYRRIDEWITTYQNLYSTTALSCLTRLTRAGLVKDKTAEVLQYTRSRNGELVRLEAFKCLTDSAAGRKMAMVRYILQSIADDPSPFFRDRLTKYFGQALGHIALGDSVKDQPKPVGPSDADAGLVLEQEVSSEVKQFEVIRKTTPEGAIAALKKVIGDDETLKRALWYATTSRLLSLDEVATFCDVAALLYPSIASCVAVARLPRSYRCEKAGKGIVRFIPHGAYRIVPRKPLALDDWEALKELGLKYSGPLSQEVKKAVRTAAEAAKILKIQMPPSRQPSFSISNTTAAPSTAPTTAPALEQSSPPPPLPLSVASATPTAEKSGFKLNLGMKRKQSIDMSSRAASPKTPKLLATQSPNGTIALAKPKGNNASRQSSISSKPGSGKSLLVKLPVSITASHKIQTIITKHRIKQKSKAAMNNQRQPDTTPSITTSPSPSHYSFSSSFSNTIPKDPFHSSEPGANMGGFRTYSVEPSAIEDEPPTVGVAYHFDRMRNSESSLAPDDAASPTASSTMADQKISAALSASPPRDGAEQGMLPPPKPVKKLTLKLGPRMASSNGNGAT